MTLIPLLASGQVGELQTELESIERARGLNVDIKDQQGKQVVLYKESHALIIGVSNYTSGWPKLPGVQRDVEAVKAALEAHGFNVIVKMDLTKNAFEQTFNEFINEYGHDSENRLLFYFAGHGHTDTLAYGGEMGYIVPADAPLPAEDERGFSAKAMDMQMIEVYARRIQSKHALFLFDSCFSGSIFAIARAAPEHITHKTANPVRQFITSGSADEQVPDESVFRQQLIAALQGEGDHNGDGYVTGSELGSFLEDTVINYTRGAQHPQYGKIRNPKLDKGDFVFQISVTISVPTPVLAQEVDPETAMWKLIEPSDNISDIKDFLATFPDGKFAKVAQLKLNQLERQQRQDKQAVSPTPLPTAAKKEMGTGTKVALGAGAVAVLGGGIALAVGGDDESRCEGVEVGGYCWYLSIIGESCDNTCYSHGGYHEATRTYAGSQGTNTNCWEVLRALGAPADTDGRLHTSELKSLGCIYWIDPDSNTVYWVRYTTYTTAENANWISSRVCACNH